MKILNSSMEILIFSMKISDFLWEKSEWFSLWFFQRFIKSLTTMWEFLVLTTRPLDHSKNPVESVQVIFLWKRQFELVQPQFFSRQFELGQINPNCFSQMRVETGQPKFFFWKNELSRLNLIFLKILGWAGASQKNFKKFELSRLTRFFSKIELSRLNSKFFPTARNHPKSVFCVFLPHLGWAGSTRIFDIWVQPGAGMGPAELKKMWKKVFFGGLSVWTLPDCKWCAAAAG